MVQPLLSACDSVVISSLENKQIYAVHEPVAGIILAAGESVRYGQAKQLLDWRGEPFVRAVARTALEAGLSPVVVVTGANAETVGPRVGALDVRVVHNPDWKDGQGSSIRTGVFAIHSPPGLPQIQPLDFSVPSEKMNVGSRRAGLRTDGVGAAIFLLADQPQVTTSILRALIEKHAQGLYPIVAPMVMDRRANPVLFDRATFRDLGAIQGDVGGRAIFHKNRVEYLPGHDDRLRLDVDTPEMYRRLISDNTL
jgi:molybdenum cofactor cytidylyltransferase